MIHSAEWTSTMRQDYDLNKESERKALLRTVGYGVPILTKALHSLIVSLETPSTDVDIYTPVENQIVVKVEVVN